MKRYEIVISGTVIYTTFNREEAEQKLSQAKRSPLALCHPVDCFYIRERD